MLKKYRIYCLFFFFVYATCLAQTFDEKLILSINQKGTPAEDRVFKTFSYSTAVIPLLPVAYSMYGLYKSNKNQVKDGIYMLSSIVCASAITMGLKYIIKRPRPFVNLTNVVKKGKGGGFSFPSGHTTEAFAFVTSLSIVSPKKRISLPLYLWAFLVGYSRIYLGVHYPSDVFAGMLLGISTSLIIYQLLYEMPKNR